MKKYIFQAMLVCAIAMLTPVAHSGAQDWSQFRGPNGVSAADAQVPGSLEDAAIAWKVKLPAKGVSSPIVVGDRVFVTSSGGSKQDQLMTLCFDKSTGKQLWSQTLWATGRCLCHPTSANAAPTPASDGTYVYSFFSSNDLACYDMNGNLVWYRGLAVDHPKAGNDVGMASSPVVHDGIVVAQVEGNADAFVTGLDARTGETVWELSRPNKSSWASPLLLTGDNNKPLVVIQSDEKLSVLELKTGKSVFEKEGKVGTIASAAIADGRVIVPFEGTTAFSVNEAGELAQDWNERRIQTSTASGVIYQNQYLALNRGGVLKSYNLDNGEPISSLRVGGSYWATPAVAGNRMYFFAQDGSARIVDLEKMEVVDERKFEDEAFLGSPAISENAMYVRGDNYLYKFSKDQ